MTAGDGTRERAGRWSGDGAPQGRRKLGAGSRSDNAAHSKETGMGADSRPGKGSRQPPGKEEENKHSQGHRAERERAESGQRAGTERIEGGQRADSGRTEGGHRADRGRPEGGQWADRGRTEGQARLHLHAAAGGAQELVVVEGVLQVALRLQARARCGAARYHPVVNQVKNPVETPVGGTPVGEKSGGKIRWENPVGKSGGKSGGKIRWKIR